MMAELLSLTAGLTTNMYNSKEYTQVFWYLSPAFCSVVVSGIGHNGSISHVNGYNSRWDPWEEGDTSIPHCPQLQRG